MPVPLLYKVPETAGCIRPRLVPNNADELPDIASVRAQWSRRPPDGPSSIEGNPRPVEPAGDEPQHSVRRPPAGDVGGIVGHTRAPGGRDSVRFPGTYSTSGVVRTTQRSLRRSPSVRDLRARARRRSEPRRGGGNGQPSGCTRSARVAARIRPQSSGNLTTGWPNVHE